MLFHVSTDSSSIRGDLLSGQEAFFVLVVDHLASRCIALDALQRPTIVSNRVGSEVERERTAPSRTIHSHFRFPESQISSCDASQDTDGRECPLDALHTARIVDKSSHADH